MLANLTSQLKHNVLLHHLHGFVHTLFVSGGSLPSSKEHLPIIALVRLVGSVPSVLVCILCATEPVIQPILCFNQFELLL